MKPCILALVAVLFAASQSHAAIVVLSTFDFTNGSLAVTSEAYAGSTSNITLGADWVANTANGNLEQLAANTGTSVTDLAHRFTFTYTVTGLAAGETLDITTADVDHTGASNTYRFNTIVDGSTIGANFNPPNTGTYVANIGTSPIGLSNTTGLVNGDSFTVAFTTRDNTAAGTLTADNYILRGDVISSVPEPTPMALIGLSSLVLLSRRRKK